MSTSDDFLKGEAARAELLLRVREADRVEMLFAANWDARDQGRPFLAVLAEQVALYERDYQAWAHEQMNRYEAQREEDEIARRVPPGFAQYHESEMLP